LGDREAVQRHEHDYVAPQRAQRPILAASVAAFAAFADVDGPGAPRCCNTSIDEWFGMDTGMDTLRKSWVQTRGWLAQVQVVQGKWR